VPYQIGTRTFGTKKEILTHAGRILKGRSIGARLDGEEEAFAQALFELHPEKETKRAGREVSHFGIGLKSDLEWAHEVFTVVFTDGEHEDFSTSKAVRAARPQR
jgi:hypothetical protein